MAIGAAEAGAMLGHGSRFRQLRFVVSPAPASLGQKSKARTSTRLTLPEMFTALSRAGRRARDYSPADQMPPAS